MYTPKRVQLFIRQRALYDSPVNSNFHYVVEFDVFLLSTFTKMIIVRDQYSGHLEHRLEK